jgi:ribosomal protein S18 acetylase RimI-like enzyme
MAELFGHPVYRVSQTDNAERDAQWETTLESGRTVFAYARIDVGDVAATNALVERGFRIVDVSVKLARAPSDSISPISSGVHVRASRQDDFDRVVEIAGSTFKYSRFHLDPLVSKSLADNIKRSWMESYRRGNRGSGCLVATLENRVVGFLAIVETTFPHPARIIDLIGVDAKSQGRGVGRTLVDTFIREASGHATRLEVGTQVANAPSVRLYENCGFRFAGAAYTLHGHFGPLRTPS